LHLLAVRGRLIEWGGGELIVGDRDIEAVAEGLEGHLAHLFLGVGDVHPLAGHPHPVALDGLGQDHGRLAARFHGRGIGVVDLHRVVAAAVQAPDVLVGHVGDHLGQLRVLAEEVLAGVFASLRLVGLVVAVDALLHAFQQKPLLVAGQERVPVAAPDDLDDVPAGARGRPPPTPG
jgi:hypothetical protein